MDDGELSDKEKYSVYLDQHRKAMEYEYSETDKFDRGQLVICLTVVIASMAILFAYGDVHRHCSTAIVFACLSLVISQACSLLSQRGFAMYRDEILQPDMSINDKKQEEYRQLTRRVVLLNLTSSALCNLSLFALMFRCLLEGEW